jgi:protein gp37
MPFGGCLPASPGCKNCFAPLQAGTLHQRAGVRRVLRPLYDGTTDLVNGKYVFNGALTSLPPEHPTWRFPLEWQGALSPIMGVGQPSLIFCSGMGDLFIDGRPAWVIDQLTATVAASRHIGQLLNRRADLMAKHFLEVPAETRSRWRRSFWLGTSAENQKWFDVRWPPMRELAGQGWTVFFSLAPLLEPIILPDDLLQYGKNIWIIASGEQGKRPRQMDPDWARSLRDQCREAAVPFFMKQTSGRKPIPADLFVREFPAAVRPHEGTIK